MEIKTIYLEYGWSKKFKFALAVNQLIKGMLKSNFEFKDIKISSNGNHSLLIFKKKEIENLK